MRIDSIRIVDFRGIEDKEFSFDPHFNVLIGENGSGKTSVLEALTVAINSYLYVSQDNKNIRPIREEDVRVENFGIHEESKIHTGLIVNGKIDERHVEWVIKKPNMDWRVMQGDDKEIKKIARSHQVMLSENGGKNLALPVFDYLGCGRLWIAPYHSNKKFKLIPQGSRYKGYEDCLKSNYSLNRLTDWYRTMEFSTIQGDETTKWRMEVVKKAIINCLEGWDDIFFSAKKDMLIAVSNEKKQELPVSFLSDGQRNIIGMVGDIAYRCVLLNPYLGINAAKESPGIVLIDELDLHLHPKWQRTIVQKLKDTFPKIQFITTTHSPFIVQSLKSEELINLEEKYAESDYLNKGVEWVAQNIMGVSNAEHSNNYVLNKELAKKYLGITDKIKNTEDSNEIQKLDKELNDLENEMKLLIERNAVNPAFAAFLELKRKKTTNTL